MAAEPYGCLPVEGYDDKVCEHGFICCCSEWCEPELADDPEPSQVS